MDTIDTAGHRPGPIRTRTTALLLLSLCGCGPGGGGDTDLVTAPTAHLSITLPANGQIVGRPYTFSVTARGANDEVIPSYLGTVRITSSDDSATLPADAALNRGRSSYTITFNRAGAHTITASDTAGNAVSVTSTAIGVVQPRLSITTSADTVIAGNALSVTVRVQGVNDALDTAFNGTLRITTTDNLATLLAATPFSAGMAQYSVTFWRAGAQTISASEVTGKAVSITSAPIEVLPVPAVAPRLDGMYPGCATRNQSELVVGAGPRVMTLRGANFLPISVVRWDSSDRPTTYISASTLRVQLTASDLAVPGTHELTVSTPAPGGGTTAGLRFNIETGLTAPLQIRIAPSGRFAFVGFGGCLSGGYAWPLLAAYAINPANGMLSLVDAPVLMGDLGLNGIQQTPDGRQLYVSLWGEGDSVGSIVNVHVDPDSGALSRGDAWTGSCDPTCLLGPWSTAMAPAGRFLYSTYNGKNSISTFSLHSTGALTPVQLLNGIGTQSQLAAHPSGQYLFAMSEHQTLGNALMAYRTTDSGSLTLTSQASVHSAQWAQLTLHPSGRFLYAANTVTKTLELFAFDTDSGGLSPRGEVPIGDWPESLAFSPSGEFAYMGNSAISSFLRVYRFDTTSGQLSLVGRTDEVMPGSMAFDPTGRYVYITNQDRNQIEICSIDPASGMLTLVGKIVT